MHGALKDEVKKTAVKTPIESLETTNVPLKQIRVREGFNPRDLEKPDTKEKIDAITESYRSDRHVPPIEVSKTADGMFEIVDGECRYTAAKKAKMDSLPVILFKGDEKDKVIHTWLGNAGEPLTPFEQIKVINTLQTKFKMKREEVAQTLGKSIQWIDRLIKIGKMPEPLKDLLIKDKRISMDVAMAYDRQYKDEAVTKLHELMENAKLWEGDKLTTKHVKEHQEKEKAKVEEETVRPPSKTSLVWDNSVDLINVLLKEGIELPEKPKAKEMYTLKVPGSAIKALAALYELLTEEDKEAAKSEAALQAKGAKGEWPFQEGAKPQEGKTARKGPAKAPAKKAA